MSILKGKGVLLSIQRNLLVELGKINETSFFCLTGGTALSEFYLAHRRSYDLDLFTSELELILPFTKALEEKLFEEQYTFKTTRRFESFVEYEVEKKGESTILHFAYDSPFRLEEPQPSEYGIKVNDYRDLVADKLLTFFGRWKHRDAVDLFFILKNEPFKDLIRMAKHKDPGFDLYWFSVALKEVDQFPDEISQWPVDMLVELNVKQLKDKFRNLSRGVMNKIGMGRSEDQI